MAHSVDTLDYWVDEFTPTRDELEGLYAYVVELGRPHGLDALAAELIRSRINRLQAARLTPKTARGTPYRPSDSFKKGQKLVFPVLDGVAGSVEGIRPGDNPKYGTYQVIQVNIDGRLREFAAELQSPHRLTAPVIDVDPEAIARRFASIVAPALANQLAVDNEWLHYGDLWVLKGLLPEVNDGHRNLAEAVIMIAGEPLPTAEILPELELAGKAATEAKEFAVVYALSKDSRFKNVGALEAPIWALASQVGG